jgi:LytS/YehU family sensor histidine kinase
MKDILNSILASYKKNPKKINEKTQKYLINYFRKEVEEIKKLGVDISKWNDYN